MNDRPTPSDDAPPSPPANATGDAPADIPEGFRRMRLGPNGFIDHVGPLYGRLDDEGRFVLGLRVRPHHCNPGGTCHGGMMMTLADMLLIIGTNIETRRNQYMTTVQVTNDFIRGVPMGAWVEGRAQVLRAAKSLIFVQGLFTVDGEVAARVSGLLKPNGEPDPKFGPERYFRD